MEPSWLGPLVDTHAHLDSPRLDGIRAELLGRAAAAGVTDVVVPGVRPESFARLLDVAMGALPLRAHVAWGIHPQVLPDEPEAWDAGAQAQVAAWCRAHPPAAIGECGLDYRVDLVRAPRERQRRVLQFHLRLARDLRLPVILHCLSAHDDLAADLRLAGPLPAGGVMHSFSGSAEQVAPFVAAGLCISFAGAVSWPGARKAPRAARAVPADRLLCETDAPDQSPHPHRGRQNEPSLVVDVLRALAEARGEHASETARRCTENARRVFGLPGLPGA